MASVAVVVGVVVALVQLFRLGEGDGRGGRIYHKLIIELMN